jgi:hypothetical protein
MNIPKKEELSARLADDVNKKLNPDEFHFSEFYFNEMVDIFNTTQRLVVTRLLPKRGL